MSAPYSEEDMLGAIASARRDERAHCVKTLQFYAGLFTQNANGDALSSQETMTASAALLAVNLTLSRVTNQAKADGISTASAEIASWTS